ncbi:hypothetical protein SUGI_0895150 [Cryptomeria japonica]|nr:hypothetical protein SUGI_0895150 [Cryptomeria japonica]
MSEAYYSNQSLNVPTLLAGLLMMAVMLALAFFLILCWHCEIFSAVSRRENQIESEHGGMNETYSCDEIEERVIVIMAGDDNPTFIAKPASLAAPDHDAHFQSSRMGV